MNALKTWIKVVVTTGVFIIGANSSFANFSHSLDTQVGTSYQLAYFNLNSGVKHYGQKQNGASKISRDNTKRSVSKSTSDSTQLCYRHRLMSKPLSVYRNHSCNHSKNKVAEQSNKTTTKTFF